MGLKYHSASAEWRWDNSRTVPNFTDWGLHQPTNLESDHCVYMRIDILGDDFTAPWYNQYCDVLMPYSPIVCEQTPILTTEIMATTTEAFAMTLYVSYHHTCLRQLAIMI